MTGPGVGEPLRIGILGAARITELSLVAPARALGHRLVAVAARDVGRARAFADRHGIERVHGGYQDVLDDPEVDVVYNPLPNSLHAPWNLAAVRSGKHVLSEKPGARDAREASDVTAAAAQRGVTVLEAFHYPFHPLWRRAAELIGSGAVGEVRHVETVLRMPAPAEDDPRWSLDLAGGALMDLGCYALHAQRQLGCRFLGGEPVLVSAVAREHAGRPGVDAAMTCRLVFPNGVTGTAVGDMETPGLWDFHLTVVGSRGRLRVPDFPRPHEDDRLLWQQAGGPEIEERWGTRSSYTYQLEAFADAVRGGPPLPYDATDMPAQAAFLDGSYAMAGLSRRPPAVSPPSE